MKTIKAKEFDENFDKTVKTKKVNVDFPEDILRQIDNEAKRIGVTRQSIIKVLIA